MARSLQLLCAIFMLLGWTSAYKECRLPRTSTDPFETATPEEVDLDPGQVQAALAYANTHNRASVQIFRHNCLVATGLLDPLTDNVAFQVFSVTKSVVGILAGMAIEDGKLGLQDPIGRYLPVGLGWGDAAHRAITVQQLLTETTGVQEAILAEGATVGLDASSIQGFLAQSLKHTPGTFFEYSQRAADAAAYVVQRAIGRDLQDYAQERLFTPLGINKSDYFWLRDRSGNTYGYAWLFIAPKHLARLGLVMQNGGKYEDVQIVPASWVKAVATPSPRNPCYGYLFWNNKGIPCTGANIPTATTVDVHSIATTPDDTYAMVGALQQNNFMLPSLNMTVTWTGLFGDHGQNLAVILSSSPGDLYYNFFRILMSGVKDEDVPDPGPYQSPPLSLDADPRNYADPVVLAKSVASSPECNILYCNGTVPTAGLLDNLQSVLGYRPTYR